jgi:hypothetical protein
LNCIIEHATKGILTDLPGDRDDKPHFSWSKPRKEALLMTGVKAKAMLPLLPHGCYILEVPTIPGTGYVEVKIT